MIEIKIPIVIIVRIPTIKSTNYKYDKSNFKNIRKNSIQNGTIKSIKNNSKKLNKILDKYKYNNNKKPKTNRNKNNNNYFDNDNMRKFITNRNNII